ncbi:MAG: hypothetical protein KDI66_06815 [Xanthomonadales bacterium]|nr:hypothetical protein [Xanthomonadales bacterium]
MAANLAFIGLPGAVLLSCVAAPYAYWMTGDLANKGSWFVNEAGINNFLPYVTQQISPSVCLVMAGVYALSQLRPRWLAVLLGLCSAAILATGFYPFRVPYLLAYLVTAILLHLAQLPSAQTSAQTRFWQTFGRLSLTVALLLMALRLLFSMENAPRRKDPPWFTQIPTQSSIADFTWDFYDVARLQGRTVFRSFPGLSSDMVGEWLKRSQPSYVIRAIDARSTWLMVNDLDAILTAERYCLQGWIDWDGESVSADTKVAPPPTPMLWRLGLYRSYGPYALWSPCQSPQGPT